MIGPETFWAMTFSIVLYSIIGPEKFLSVWEWVKAPIASIARFWLRKG